VTYSQLQGGCAIEMFQSQAKNLATPPKKEEEPLTDHAKLAKSEAELRKMCEK